MQPTLIPAIAEAFLRQYGFSQEADRLVALQTRLTHEQEFSLDEFLAKLTEFGSQFNLVFLSNDLPSGELSKLALSGSYPFLVFSKKGTSLYPILVHAGKGERFATAFTAQGEQTMRIERVEDLGDLQRHDGLSEADSIVVITCFPHSNFEEPEELRAIDVGSVRFKLFSKLLKLLQPERKEILYIFLYAILIGIISLSLPLGVQSLIGFISSGQVVTSVVVLIAFILLGIVFSGIMTIYQLELVEFLHQKLFTRTAFSFASRIPRIRLESVLQYYPPELMNRFFDTITLQKGLPILLIDITAATLQVIFGILLLSFYHPLFIVMGSVLVFLLIFILRMTGPKGLATAMTESDYKYRVANWLEEIARTLSTFKLAGHTSFALDKTDHLVSNYVQAREDHFRVLKKQYYSFVVFKTIVTAMLLILGAVLIVDRQINLGQFVAAEIVIIMTINSIEKIILKIDKVYDVLVGVEKITKVTSLPVEEYKGIDLVVPKNSGLSIRTENLGYRFPDRAQPTLNGVSLKVDASERIAITGYNSSGKSTLINLILGLYDSYSGNIQFNGVSLRELNKASLMNHVGDFVSEEALFDGTILENISIGRKGVTMEDVLWACNAAGLNDFLSGLPEGLNTRLVGGPVRVPESMVKKIVIARNIVEHPALLILDDFLLGVERREKKRILELILDRNYGWTVILISNDPVVLTAVDRVVVMKEGRIVDEGTFDALSSRSEEFRELIQNYPASL